jgi:hypothetical protein
VFSFFLSMVWTASCCQQMLSHGLVQWAVMSMRREISDYTLCCCSLYHVQLIIDFARTIDHWIP